MRSFNRVTSLLRRSNFCSSRFSCISLFNSFLLSSVLLTPLSSLEAQQRVAIAVRPFSDDYSMAWTSSGSSNEELINNLYNNHLITSQPVKQALLSIDRADFCPSRSLAYEDSPQSIGYGATISAPHLHAMCLELLADVLKPGCRALDVGSGSGYLLAAFAQMIGKDGKVFGIEHIAQLVEVSKKNLERAHLPDVVAKMIDVRVGDGRLGLPDEAPFNAIHVGAAAAELPQPLIDQLAVGGKMIIPLGVYSQDLMLIEKLSDGSVKQRSVTGVMYVPLTSQEAQLRGRMV